MKTFPSAWSRVSRAVVLWLCVGIFGLTASASAQAPFRLIFNAWNGNPKVDKPEQIEFQINTVDLRQPAEFLKLGDMIPNTRFKLVGFEYKEVRLPNLSEPVDVSELTIVHQDTGQKVVLVIGKVTNVGEMNPPPGKVPK